MEHPKNKKKRTKREKNGGRENIARTNCRHLRWPLDVGSERRGAPRPPRRPRRQPRTRVLLLAIAPTRVYRIEAILHAAKAFGELKRPGDRARSLSGTVFEYVCSDAYILVIQPLYRRWSAGGLVSLSPTSQETQHPANHALLTSGISLTSAQRSAPPAVIEGRTRQGTRLDQRTRHTTSVKEKGRTKIEARGKKRADVIERKITSSKSRRCCRRPLDVDTQIARRRMYNSRHYYHFLFRIEYTKTPKINAVWSLTAFEHYLRSHV